MVWEIIEAIKRPRNERRTSSNSRSEPSKPTAEKRDKPVEHINELDERAQAYLLHEYDAHSRFVAMLVNKLGRDLRFGFFATAGYWGWVLVQGEAAWIGSANPLAWLPTVLVFVMFCRAFFYNREIDRIQKYRKDVEQKFKLPGRLGFFSHRKKYGADLPRSSIQLIWFLLILVNAFAPCCVRKFLN